MIFIEKYVTMYHIIQDIHIIQSNNFINVQKVENFCCLIIYCITNISIFYLTVQLIFTMKCDIITESFV